MHNFCTNIKGNVSVWVTHKQIKFTLIRQLLQGTLYLQMTTQSAAKAESVKPIYKINVLAGSENLLKFLVAKSSLIGQI